MWQFKDPVCCILLQSDRATFSSRTAQHIVIDRVKKKCLWRKKCQNPTMHYILCGLSCCGCWEHRFKLSSGYFVIKWTVTIGFSYSCYELRPFILLLRQIMTEFMFQCAYGHLSWQVRPTETDLGHVTKLQTILWYYHSL